MVRMSAEVEVPEDQAEVFKLALRRLCDEWDWRLASVQKSVLDPPCPQCGAPMEWDRDFGGYVCHHAA